MCNNSQLSSYQVLSHYVQPDKILDIVKKRVNAKLNGLGHASSNNTTSKLSICISQISHCTLFEMILKTNFDIHQV